MGIRGAVATLVVAVVTLTGVPAGAMEATAAGPGADRAPERIVVGYTGSDHPVVLHTPRDGMDRTLRALQADPAVEYAEHDARIEAADLTPNDPLWGSQGAIRQVGGPRAWSTSTGDPSVVVAVLDSGVDASHEDLVGATVTGWNVLTDTAQTGDDFGHGTAVASVVAARTDNGQGVAGLCWTCAVMPVKVLDANGAGYVSDLAAGIRWATDHGAAVINMSVAGPTSTRTLTSAVDYALANGVALVASAGNHAGTAPTYPAAYEGVIGVGAATPSDQQEDYSNSGDWVDLAAPGCSHAAGAAVSGGGYRAFCGTSAAAPVVAGILGLARAVAPDPGVDVLRGALESTAVPVGSWVHHGRVDAAATVELLADTTDPDPTPSPSPEPEPSYEPEPEPEPDPDDSPQAASSDRLAGGDRYATAATISASMHEPGVARVYVGTGRAYPDALAAGPAAAVAGGPVLLTDPAALPAATAAELSRLDPEEIVVVGGTGSVSRGVERLLGHYGTVRRVAGPDRYSTAAAVALDTFTGPVPVLYLASGRNFPDALSGGATAAIQGAPLLLTDPDGLPDVTEAAVAQLQPEHIVVLGGPGAVADPVLSVLRLLSTTVTRLSGENRFATASEISQWAFPEASDVVYLATGADFPDALAGGPAAAATDGPLLLVQRDTLPATVFAELERLNPRRIVALGGRAAVSDATLQAALAATAR
ncbi:MAG: cell wall-binding repeat-containing protein [Egibacteraceae bacterium]